MTTSQPIPHQRRQHPARTVVVIVGAMLDKTVAAIVAGGLVALVLGVFTITYRVDQVIVGGEAEGLAAAIRRLQTPVK